VRWEVKLYSSSQAGPADEEALAGRPNNEIDENKETNSHFYFA
jgi:hypothetical protein